MREILSWYASEPPVVAHKIGKLLNSGAIAGTGKFTFLSLDSLYYKGVLRELVHNLKSLQPSYAYELAIKGEVSALVAPLKNLEASARDFSGDMNLFAQLLEGNSQEVYRAMQLGCMGVSMNFKKGDCHLISKLSEEASKLGLLLRVHVEDTQPLSFEALSQISFKLSQNGVHILSLPFPEGLFDTGPTKDKFHQLCVNLKKTQDQIKLIRESAVNGEILMSFYGLEERMKELPQVVSGGAMGYDFSTEYFQVTLDAAVDKMKEIYNIYTGE